MVFRAIVHVVSGPGAGGLTWEMMFMARDFAKAFYKSTAWKDCRASYIKSVGGLCEDCLAKGIYTPAKVVHHIVNISPGNINDPSITLSWMNLKAVCQDCHAREHSDVDSKYGGRYTFDENGNVVAK